MARDLLLLLLLLLCGIALFVNGRRVHPMPHSSISGIEGNPGLAMEFARSQDQVTALLGPPNTEQAISNRKIMAWQQYIDFFYIVLYWAFFFFVVGGPMRASHMLAGRLLGQLLGVLITVAAIADILEDIGILLALRPGYEGPFWPFGFGVTKWLCFYVALLSSTAFFAAYPRLGNFPMASSRLDLVAIAVGILLFVSSVAGLIGAIGAAGSIPDQAAWLPKAFLPLLIAFPLLLAWFASGMVLYPPATVHSGHDQQ